MRVLIFGANGYVGSHLIKRMIADGHEVSGFVRSDGAASRLLAVGAKPILGDLADLDASIEHMAHAEAIIYAAQLLLQAEQDTVKEMLEAIQHTNKIFIFTSGTGVLSIRTDGDWDENSYSESDEFVPYKLLKIRYDTENLVRAAASRGICALVVRPPTIWGNGGAPVIKALVHSAVRTGAVCYIGRGLNLYSNVHIQDLAELYTLVLHKGRAGSIYHAVAGEVNFRTIAEGVARTLGLGTRSITLAEAIAIWDKTMALIVLSVCSRTRSPRARQELGWKPSPHRLDLMDETAHLSL